MDTTQKQFSLNRGGSKSKFLSVVTAFDGSTRCLMIGALALSVITLATSSTRAATTGPDLSVTLNSNTSVFAQAVNVASLTVTNRGNAAAPTVSVSYTPGQPSVQPSTPGYVCSPVLKGHSGRGGGSTRVGWSCSQTSAAALAPGASAVIQFSVTYPRGTFSEAWTASAGSTPQLNLVSHAATATVVSSQPPIPSAPTGVSVSQSGDSLVVAWHAPGVGGTAVTSSTVTATPGSGAPILTARVTGPVTSATVAGVQPSTTYSVTVRSTDAAGTGPSSAPATFMTHASITPPGVPTGVRTWWTSYNGLVVAWTASVPGDSPVDDYQVSATGSDGGGTIMFDAGTSTEALVPVPDSTQDWTVIVRAHNVAGWSDWSAPVTQPGL